MNRATGHAMAVRREIEEGRLTPTNNLGMKIVNLDNFTFSLKDGDKSEEHAEINVNIGELVKLKEHIDSIIGGVSETIEMFVRYDKKSPKYWGTIEKCEEYKTYNVSIDLENFMHEESEGKEMAPDYFLPDNYALAKKLERKFKKSGGDMKGECGEHFRECASWDFKSKAKAKKLISFIDKTYVKPSLEERKKHFNIKKVNFPGNEQITFEYNS